MRKRVDEAELPFIGVAVLGRLVVESARLEHDVNDGISANPAVGLLGGVRQQCASHLPLRCKSL